MTSDTNRGGASGLDAANSIWTMTCLCLLGFALRVWYAHWPLWVDEIWSLKDLVPISHFWQILWAISQDNNHYLYSIYLFFAYPISRNEIWLRAPSIVAGVAAIPLMARLAGRDPVAALAAAVMTAVSTFLVTYSAQARGYALAVLFWIVAYRQLEKAMDAPASRARWYFALAIGAGAFCHLATFAVAVLFGLAAFCEFLRRERDLLRAIRKSLQLFWPTLVGLTPILLCLVAGYVEVGGFILNFLRPYSPVLAFAGFSQMIVATLVGAHDAGPDRRRNSPCRGRRLRRLARTGDLQLSANFLRHHALRPSRIRLHCKTSQQPYSPILFDLRSLSDPRGR